MTDIARARDASVAAETRVEHLFDDVLDRFHQLNARLVELHDQIKAAQPISSGAVCLELYPCGPGCLGCPHPRWVRYKWADAKGGNSGMLMGTNLGAKGKDPVLALTRKFENYEETAALVRQAKAVLKERAGLLASIRSLRYAAKLNSSSAETED